MNPSDYEYLRTLPGNATCVDCGEDRPEWGSPKLGVLFCLQCSAHHRCVCEIIEINRDGRTHHPHAPDVAAHSDHDLSPRSCRAPDETNNNRGLGTHLSFVRSVTMDRWTDRQVQLMKAGGGNRRCNEFLKSRSSGIVTSTSPENRTREFYMAKYDCPAAELYRQVLVARVEGRPEPTELPKVSAAAATRDNEGREKKKMVGFGSTSPPPRSTDSRRAIKRAAVAVGVGAAAVAIWLLLPR